MTILLTLISDLGAIAVSLRDHSSYPLKTDGSNWIVAGVVEPHSRKILTNSCWTTQFILPQQHSILVHTKYWTGTYSPEKDIYETRKFRDWEPIFSAGKYLLLGASLPCLGTCTSGSCSLEFMFPALQTDEERIPIVCFCCVVFVAHTFSRCIKLNDIQAITLDIKAHEWVADSEADSWCMEI